MILGVSDCYLSCAVSGYSGYAGILNCYLPMVVLELAYTNLYFLYRACSSESLIRLY